jgi:hypothetical protein
MSLGGLEVNILDIVNTFVYSAVNHGLMNVVAIKKKQTKESMCVCVCVCVCVEFKVRQSQIYFIFLMYSSINSTTLKQILNDLHVFTFRLVCIITLKSLFIHSIYSFDFSTV